LQGVEQDVRVETVLAVVCAVNAIVAQDDSELHGGISVGQGKEQRASLTRCDREKSL
jgi:hypothetical protein